MADEIRDFIKGERVQSEGEVRELTWPLRPRGNSWWQPAGPVRRLVNPTIIDLQIAEHGVTHNAVDCNAVAVVDVSELAAIGLFNPASHFLVSDPCIDLIITGQPILANASHLGRASKGFAFDVALKLGFLVARHIDNPT